MLELDFGSRVGVNGGTIVRGDIGGEFGGVVVVVVVAMIGVVVAVVVEGHETASGLHESLRRQL